MEFLNGKGNRNGKRVVSALLVLSFLVAVPALQGGSGDPLGGSYVLATTAKDKKNEAEQGLSDVEDDIRDIEGQQSQINNQISSQEQKLDALLKQQDALNVQIGETQARADQANLDLAAAEEKRDEEYESMKLRIQFMYENNTDDSIWSAIFNSNGFSDMLNRIEYIADVYQSDRELMDAYEQSVKEVEDLTIQLAAEMDELYGLQESYLGQQAQIEELLSSLAAQSQKYAEQLAEAQQRAESYRKTIAEQEEIIRQQQIAEAEARRRQQEEAARAQAQANANANNNTNTNTGTSSDPAFTSSVSGQELVSYALQFVGNPYVWGGNSLTKGCDCSGFVHLVYEHFGFSTPRYSLSFASVGQPVSRENIKAGDIVVYSPKNGVGHVAIYIGNGCIVEAQDVGVGITSNRSVDCRSIMAIRRLL